MPNLLKIATKGAEIGFQVGKFAAGQAVSRVSSLIGRDGQQDRYAPTAGAGAARPEAPRPAAAPKPAAPKPAPVQSIKAKPSTGDTKGETTTTVKATSRTGARSAGGRISNPKAAKKVRARKAAEAKAVEKTDATVPPGSTS